MYGYPKNYNYPTAYIRGGSSAPAFSPSDVSGLTRWYKADALSLNDGDVVTTWTDSSGTSNATQTTALNKPTYKTGIVNSKPVVRFDGVNSYLNIGNLSALTAGEAFVVVKLNADPPVSEGGLWQIGSEATAATQFPFPGDGVIYDQFGRTGRVTTVNPTPSLAAWHIYSVYSTTNDWQNFLDGTSLFSTATNTVGFDTACTLGMSSQNGTTFIHLAGDIAEFILYNAKLSAGNRSSVISHLKTKYGIA